MRPSCLARSLLLLLLASCSPIPDNVELHYGRTFAGDGGVGFDFAEIPFGAGDSDFVGVSFGYKLKPTEVVNVGSLVPQQRGPDLLIPPPDTISENVHEFDALDWTTKLALLVAVCWLGWVYRRQLGRLIPGNNNGNGAKK